MKCSWKYLLISLLLLSLRLEAQTQLVRTDGLAVRTYFLGKKKIMESRYDEQGRLTLEWCNRTDLLHEYGYHPYVRVYEYNDRETKITTYIGRLKNEKRVVFDQRQNVHVIVERMNDDKFESSGGAVENPLRTYPLKDLPRAKVSFRKHRDISHLIRYAIKTDSTIRKNLIRDTTNLNKVVPKFSSAGEDAKVFPKQDVPGGIYYDEKGRLKKKETYFIKDFTFSKEPVYRIESRTLYFYPDANTELIVYKNFQKSRLYKILITKEFY